MKEQFMSIALEEAKKGEGIVNPNPLVGAVIVENGKLVSKAYHGEMGVNHAEIVALKKLSKKVDPKNCEMYVSLEPCCHFGKTPPCVKAIIESGIKKVYIGVLDPNPEVSGKGVEVLKEAGIEVELGLMGEEARELNQVFFKYIREKKPYLCMKLAMTLDGKIASKTGDSKWISNEESRKDVHRLRNKYMGIMVGIGTVLKDNPRLDCRLENSRNPVRIILDSSLRIDLNANVVKEQNKAKTIIFTGRHVDRIKKDKLVKMGVEVLEVEENSLGLDLEEVILKLGEKGIDSILLEGGGQVNYSALEEDIVDKLIFYIAPKIVGGQEAKSAIGGSGVSKLKDAFNFTIESSEKIDGDLKLEAYKRRW